MRTKMESKTDAFRRRHFSILFVIGGRFVCLNLGPDLRTGEVGCCIGAPQVPQPGLSAYFMKKCNENVFVSHRRRRSQDFVWGALFLAKKVDDLFSRRPQIPSKYTSKSNPPNKNCHKNWLLFWLGGCTSCPGGALTHFSCKLGRKKFFSPPWGVQVHPPVSYTHLTLPTNREV